MRPYPLAKWRGAKTYLASRIVAQFPPGRVVDAFGGAGSIVTAAGGGLWNEIDGRLVRLARALKEDWRALRDAAAALPTDDGGSALWAEARTQLDDVPPHVFAWCLYATWGGRLAGTCHISNRDSARIWRKWIAAIERRAVAWRNVTVSEGDYRDVALQTGDVLFLDPPYPDTGSGGYVGVVDSRDMLRWADAHDGPVILVGWSDSYDVGWPSMPIDGGFRRYRNNGYANGATGRLTHLWSRDGFTQTSMAI